MNPKISADHLKRRAIVYIRQSSPGQVIHNQESQRRQYGLADHARQLGFEPPPGKRGSEYASFVRWYADRTGEIVSDNKLPIFPNYADHGIEHINRLLESPGF